MGFLFTIAIFAMCLLPMCIDFFTLNVTTSQFLNASTEMQQLVSEEGGITERVHNVMDSSAINYTFKDKAGQEIDGVQDVGKEIYIDYKYDWKGIFTKDTLETTNTVRVARR